MLWVAGRYHAWRRQKLSHPFLLTLAQRLGYRFPITATLSNGMPIKVPAADEGGWAVYVTGSLESETVEFLKTILARGMTFLDIGAAFGQYTLLGSPWVGAAGIVHAFEPDPKSLEWLRHNVTRNRLANVTIAPIALSSAPGRQTIYVGAPDNLGATSFFTPYNFAGESYQVESQTLDDYVKDRQVNRVDVIKLDVEGAELAVLAGADRVLRDFHPAIIIEFEETNQSRAGKSCAELADFLRSKGYTLRSILPGGVVPYRPEHNVDHHLINVIAS